MTVIPVYNKFYDEKLLTAYPLVEGKPDYNYMISEYNESYYSF